MRDYLPLLLPVATAALFTTFAAAVVDLPVTLDEGEPAPHAAPEPPPPDDPRDELPPLVVWGEDLGECASVVFVLDASSSMAIEDVWFDDRGIMHGSGTGSRWDKAVRETLLAVDRLAPSVLFDVLTYDCATQILWPELEPATDQRKTLARLWLEEQSWRGGTGTGAAVATALELRPEVVVLLTDGLPTCDLPEPQHRQIARSANHGSRVDCCGINLENAAARESCRAFASEAGGRFWEVGR